MILYHLKTRQTALRLRCGLSVTVLIPRRECLMLPDDPQQRRIFISQLVLIVAIITVMVVVKMSR